MARMRSIKGAVEYLKQQDPDTICGEWWLRGLIKRGEIPHHRAGAKVFLDLDQLERFLANPPPIRPHDNEDDYNPRKIKRIECR